MISRTSGLGPGPEFDLIRRFAAGRATSHRNVRLGPGDDCAVVTGGAIVLSVDMSIEGIHFQREWIPSFDVGWRAASAALSDLAAMGASPIGVLASLATREADAGGAAAGVMEGVGAAVEAIGGVLLGGDLTRSPGPLTIDVTAVGEAAEPLLRSGAAPGDEVWVTGELGGAATAVASLLRGESPPAGALERFARPSPRIREAIWLREQRIPRAMLDLSDGLAGDAAHLAAASGVAIVLERDAVPLHPAAVACSPDRGGAIRLATAGGEDYELCFVAAPGSVEPNRAAFERGTGVGLTRVGIVEEGTGVYWRAPGGGREPLERGGYQHFG